MILGIDASRNRSGGAIAHLRGVLGTDDPRAYGITAVHLWSYRSLLDQVPSRPWLIKHNPNELEGSLLKQLWWQAVKLSQTAGKMGCDVLFTTDASTVCKFKPMVTLSQDMLSYEPGVMRLFGVTTARIRLLGILWLQNRALRRSAGAIFLTRYAASIIQRSCGSLTNVAYIPHGVGDEFRRREETVQWPADVAQPIRCIYVSNAAMYKHQWQVVRAIAKLRQLGYNITLDLIGGGAGKAQMLLDAVVMECDPDAVFIKQRGKIGHAELPDTLREAHLFVFASSCENLPVTLLEGMATGLPIACSQRGPMREVLQDGGVYFDPENVSSIIGAIEKLVTEPLHRKKMSLRAKAIAEDYTWSRCSSETWQFLARTYQKKLQNEATI